MSGLKDLVIFAILLVGSKGLILLKCQYQISSKIPQMTSSSPFIRCYYAQRYRGQNLGNSCKYWRTLLKFWRILVTFLGFLSMPLRISCLPLSLLIKSLKKTPFLNLVILMRSYKFTCNIEEAELEAFDTSLCSNLDFMILV